MSSDIEAAHVFRGTVKRFSDSAGYGFIQRDSEVDVFVHYKAIIGEGFRSLVPGDEVEFEIEQGPRGPAAIRVRRVPAS